MKAVIERNTRQKRAIRGAFEGAGRPLSIDEVLASAERESEGLGMATVYRSIRALLDDGWLTSIEVPGKGAYYEIAGKAHHHHFSCTKCHRVYELAGCSSEVSVRLPRGFRASGHDVTIYGLCSACTTASKPVVRKRSSGSVRARS